ncbi:SEC-C domain-containing protein [Marivirga sp. S37H4]|uniref:SEC-C domain-containing protein n=1 Tax=Marivirga aurantiaca TaxID=2802615 RepID=A0A935CBA7_9BACT|nr:SEC-C domain-containing protein [Marivirga aurantiaca]MBK6266979.1 SEC-C domain-containing protein [Marivirga aurantiaca]
MKEIGRNDLCHCGSGKKYKNCHMGRSGEITSNKNILFISVFVVILAIAGFSIFYNSDNTPSSRNNNTNQSLTPPPPGEAPPGKVWSKEHGHYHDI